jgi:2-desacetyl-2-hydroxyethyl bacteriochlorophyllide A dehydrogenase
MIRSLRLEAFGQPLREVALPDPQPGPDEVVIEVRAAGICHSDAHYRAGRGTIPRLPLTLGHEIAGTVIARGAHVTEPALGARVAVHYLVSCGTCRRCRVYGEQFCETGGMIGKEHDGGQSERVVIPARNAVPIPDAVSDEIAAVMMCSTATAYHALRLATVRPGDSVAILGFGGLGVSALQLARILGAGAIFAVDRVPEKLATARDLGATPIAAEELRDVDVILDFTGHPPLLTTAVRALAPGGRLMLVAINARHFECDPYQDVLGKETRIIGCSDHTRDELVELLRLAEAGTLDLSRAITRRVPFEADAVNGVLDDLDGGTPHLRTVCVP